MSASPGELADFTRAVTSRRGSHGPGCDLNCELDCRLSLLAIAGMVRDEYGGMPWLKAVLDYWSAGFTIEDAADVDALNGWLKTMVQAEKHTFPDYTAKCQWIVAHHKPDRSIRRKHGLAKSLAMARAAAIVLYRLAAGLADCPAENRAAE